MKNKKSVRAFAPASIGNVSIGFDIFGMALEGVGDEVILTSIDEPRVILKSIQFKNQSQEFILPTQTPKNTATAALQALRKVAGYKKGFSVELIKGIPLGSGMGGSAASAVAAVVAGNAFLSKKLSKEVLLKCALEGERVASGAAHPDNIAPSLYGGLTMASMEFKNPVIELPLPKNIYWILVHPDLQIETRQARGILKTEVPLEQMVHQTAHLASFLAGLYSDDKKMIQQGFQDLIIEPQRQKLIPGFKNLKKSIDGISGVIGFSISGSGPSVFAWVDQKKSIAKVSQMIQNHFKKHHYSSQVYWGQGKARGAHIL
jgi:homoserine kinase